MLRKEAIKIANKYFKDYDMVTDRDLDSFEMDHNFRNLAEELINVQGDGNVFTINSISDLPDPVSNVITLNDNATYIFTTIVDISNNRLVAGINTVILGYSSENCGIHNNLDNEALLSSVCTMPMRHLQLIANGTDSTILDLNATGVENLDWYGVNFLNSDIGSIKNYQNTVIISSAFINCTNGFVLDGSVSAFVVDMSALVTPQSGLVMFDISDDMTFISRFRLSVSSWRPPTGVTIVNWGTGVTVPDEGVNIFNNTFTGAGVSIAGIDQSSNKTLFKENLGLKDTFPSGNMGFNSNATATTIGDADVWIKAAGSTISQNAERFTHTNNRLTYTGSKDRDFNINVSSSLTSGNNKIIHISIFVNGSAMIVGSDANSTSNAGGRSENIVSISSTELSPNDYIEVFVKNETDTANITLTDSNLIISEV